MARVIRHAPIKSNDDPPPKTQVSRVLAQAWVNSVNVTERDIAAHAATPAQLRVGEALLNGKITLPEVAEFTKLDIEEVRAVFTDPVAMAWLSRAIYAQLQHVTGLVDMALFNRAMSGDVAAARLFYERANKLSRDKGPTVQISGGLNITALSDDDLKKLIQDTTRKLPEVRVIDVQPLPEAPAP